MVARMFAAVFRAGLRESCQRIDKSGHRLIADTASVFDLADPSFARTSTNKAQIQPTRTRKF